MPKFLAGHSYHSHNRNANLRKTNRLLRAEAENYDRRFRQVKMRIPNAPNGGRRNSPPSLFVLTPAGVSKKFESASCTRL